MSIDTIFIMNRIRSFMSANNWTLDPADIEPLEQSIKQKLQEGWLPDEVFAHIKNNEAVNPEIGETEALANMARVRARLHGSSHKVEVHGKAVMTEGPTVAGHLRALACIEALQELVRLKDIKERMNDLYAHPASMHGSREVEEFKYLKAEYDLCKDAAWKRAQEALNK